MVCTLGGFEQGDGTGVLGFVRLVGILGIVDVFAAVEAGGYIAAVVDDGAVLVLMLARRHLTVAVAVALDSGVILAGLQLGSVIHTQAAPALKSSAGAVGNHIGSLRKGTCQTMHPDSGRALLIFTGLVQGPVALRCVRKG